MPFDVSTAQSLHELEQLSARGLTGAELAARLDNAGVDSDRARWLLKLLRRRRWSGPVRRIGYALATIGFVTAVIVFILALCDSPLAPAWLYVFIPSYLALFAVLAAWSRMIIEVSTRIDLPPLDNVPPLLAAAPRNANDSGRTRRILTDILAGLGMLAIAMPLTIMYPRVRIWSALRARGVETTGVITGKRIVNAGRSRMRSISYRFETAQETVTGSQPVSRTRYERARDGDPTPVTYLERNTWANLPEHKRDLTWSYLAPMLGPLLIMVGFVGAMAALFHFGMRRLQTNMLAVARNGRVALARVKAVNRQRLTYEFETPEGPREGFLILRKKKLRQPATIGQKLAVLYDPAKPQTYFAVAALDDVIFE